MTVALATSRIRRQPSTRLPELRAAYGDLDGTGLLRPMIENAFPGRIALVSSFGAESSALLALVAEIDSSVPVIFLDTGKLFGETLRYRDRLVGDLGLLDVRTVKPDASEIARRDPDGMLWSRDADACCALRKVRPLEDALTGFDAWITGRKRFHSENRQSLPLIDASAGRIKVNPLANWTADKIAACLKARGLPAHPLVEDGFLSIGCMPCTERVAPGGKVRDGRWAGLDKVECGIHGFIDGDGI